MMIPLLLMATEPKDAPILPGLPVLSTSNRYRILTENVQLNVLKDGTVEVSSTTVYRNLGGKADARVFLNGFPTQIMGSAHPYDVTWDKQPVKITLGTAAQPGVSFQTTLGDQATHSLRIRYPSVLTPFGYGKDQYRFQYKLMGDHPIELFSMAYRYVPGSVFGLPTVQPDLGWEVGERGASIRKENFNPEGATTDIHFYWNSMKPLGNG